MGIEVCGAPQERLRQKKEYDIVINERDILGTQLIRRNDELALLYEKIKIQQSTLNKGQIQYRDRLNEIRVLKIKLNDLKRELHILKNSVANIDVLKVISPAKIAASAGAENSGLAANPPSAPDHDQRSISTKLFFPWGPFSPPFHHCRSHGSDAATCSLAEGGPPPGQGASAGAHQGEGSERRA